MKKTFFKKVILIICILAVTVSTLAASELRYIQYSNIKNTAEYEEDLLFAINNENYLDLYVPDDYWYAPCSRVEYVTRLTALYDKLVAYEEPENQDYLLLKGVICTFLYNLDEEGFHERALETYQSIEQFPNRDYRYLWFMGNLYIVSSKIKEGVACYEQIFDRLPREVLHPDLFLYSAKAYGYAQMTNCAIRDFRMYETLTGESVESFSGYQQQISKLRDYDGATIDEDTLLRWRTKDDVVGIQSTLYGFWLVPDGDWTVKASTFLPDRYIFSAGSPSITTDKGNITYSFMMISSLGNTAEEAFSYSMADKLIAQNDAKRVNDILPDRDDIAVYEWTDPSKYQAIGGAHCYVALIVRPYSETADCDMEFPYEYSFSGGTQFYNVPDIYSRYKGCVVTLLLMDSCEEINGETKAALISVLEQSSFY